ncbi:MAG: hypothetical protein M1326_06540 [Cyanobacteria bacterium]|nr:hypothetical protein [Cyanobacteriota bacterium]
MNMIFLYKLKKKLLSKEFVFLYFILLLGLFLRTFKLWDNIIFSYDQARDAQRIFDMVYNKHLKIVGPETDIPGVFNGPLFYYLLTPIYFLFNFDPNYAALFMTIINISTVFLIYWLAVIIFKKVGLIASFIWSISFEQSNFSKYISNASLMSISSIVFFLGLAIFIFRKKNYGLTLSIIGLACSVQFNFYLIYLVLIYFILFFIYPIRIKIKQIVLNCILLFIMLSSFIVAEIKFKFLALRSLLSYFSNSSNPVPIIDVLSSYLQKLSETIYNTIFSFNHFIALCIFIFLFILIFKNKNKSEILLLTIWLFSTLPLFGFRSGVVTTPVINTSIFGAIILIISGGLNELLKTNKKQLVLGLFFLVIFTSSNLILYKKNNFLNYQALGQKAMFLSYEKKVIDYTYDNSHGAHFSICAVTEPLFINTLWSYLYKFYGQKKYGYLPYWSGAEQFLNINNLAYDKDHIALKYLILENQGGIPDYATKGTIFSEDKVSYIEKEDNLGGIMVQQRKSTHNKNQLKDSQHLDTQGIAWLTNVTKIDHRFSCSFNY